MADQAWKQKNYALEERSLALREQEAAIKRNTEFDAERQGLVAAIRSGQLTPGQALQQIEEDTQLGFYTPEQAAVLKRDLQTIATGSTTTPSTPDQTKVQEELRKSPPSDKELDAQARKLGYPILDYRAYAKDPNGMMAGVSFEQWRQLYGPKLGR